MSLLIAAATSGSGKTTLTLGLLRALRNKGLPVRSAKLGPDYIDPRFHEAATGLPCPNLDSWAMARDRLQHLSAGDTPLLIEGAMGIFDGAGGGTTGSCEDLAQRLDLSIVLVLDTARTSRSIAAIAEGIVNFNPALRFHGLILNNVGSDRHEAMLRAAVDRPSLPPVLGAVRRDPRLAHPGRHLGLVQASERTDLEGWLNTCAAVVEGCVDTTKIADLAHGTRPVPSTTVQRMPPLGQRIAVARDEAFAFVYPHMLNDWKSAGAEILPFSPLANERPAPDADAIYMPGGYPELHAGRLAGNATFMQSLRNAKENTVIYGECGGYMTLGEGLIDASGVRHQMAGLLPLETSFKTRKLQLGYRRVTARAGPFLGAFTAHEFHYSTELRADGDPLFDVRGADGQVHGPSGLRSGNVSGSYLHIIDRDPLALDPPYGKA